MELGRAAGPAAEQGQGADDAGDHQPSLHSESPRFHVTGPASGSPSRSPLKERNVLRRPMMDRCASIIQKAAGNMEWRSTTPPTAIGGAPPRQRTAADRMLGRPAGEPEIGRASVREKVCQYR